MDNKPDHPMHNAAEARRLLGELPKGEPLKALAEVTDWLNSFKGTPGFQLEHRIAVAMLLDEAGQPRHAELLRRYLDEPHLQDFQGMRQWHAMHAFAKAQAETYAVCVAEYHQAKPSVEIRERMPVLYVRLLRAVAAQMKLEFMRYLDVEPGVWGELYRHYLFAESEQCADRMVIAYPAQVIHTSPQRELLRALALYLSSPGTLAPNQIEVSFRIAGRMVSFFEFSPEPDLTRPYFIDLAHPVEPGYAGSDPQLTPEMRFFGMNRAIPRLTEIVHQNEQGMLDEERRFGNEFTPDGKLTVLKHLMQHWGELHLHRHQERRGISSEIEVVHGFKSVSKLVAHIELDHVVGLSAEEVGMLEERDSVGLSGVEENYTSENWLVQDMSNNGLGALMPQAAGGWVKIGMVCGLKGKQSSLWWVGMIRRLKTDAPGKVHAGIEILTKKPLAVWLRALGKGVETTSNWETSSGSFEYDYLPVILLPDEHNAYLNATMLMESGSFVRDAIFEVMMGEKSRNIKLTEILAEGDDYEQVRFEWLGAE
ncbi:MAG: hypothetical protein GC139_03455 [Sideroxydans sp.]|nr:hypothetical protein [Sideroxydans sp.]